MKQWGKAVVCCCRIAILKQFQTSHQQLTFSMKVANFCNEGDLWQAQSGTSIHIMLT